MLDGGLSIYMSDFCVEYRVVCKYLNALGLTLEGRNNFIRTLGGLKSDSKGYFDLLLTQNQHIKL